MIVLHTVTSFFFTSCSPNTRTSSNNPILGQNHFRKSSDPSLCSGDDASRFLNDPMKTSINSRRNTIANSCSPGQQHKQQNQMNLSSSSNRNHVVSGNKFIFVY